MTTNQFNAALGFAFVLVAVTLSLGWAVLALVSAAGFYLIGSVLRGENALQDLEERFRAFARPSRSG